MEWGGLGNEVGEEGERRNGCSSTVDKSSVPVFMHHSAPR